MPTNLENSAVAMGLEKVSVHSKPKERPCQSVQTTTQLQAGLQQLVNRELPDVQAGFRKGRGTRDQIAKIRWII